MLAMIVIIIDKFVLAKIQEYAADKASERIAANDEYLKVTANITQIDIVSRPICHAIASSTPIIVATPFPPLNLNQTGKIWPITEKIPATIARSLL